MAKARCAITFTSLLALGVVSGSAGATDLNECKEQTAASVAACQRLAEKEDPDGLFGLGMLYLEGIGVRQDYTKALKLMRKAAFLGNQYAQLQVGQAYANGQGTEINYEEAYAWFLVSKENGNDVAQQGIDFLSANNAVKQNRLNAVTQRANDIYASIKEKKGFKFDSKQGSMPVSGVTEFCDMVMPPVDAVIQLKKYGKPRSDAQQLVVGMTDPKAIKMVNGAIEWVWSTRIEPEQMHDTFKAKCLKQDPEVGFLFQQ